MTGLPRVVAGRVHRNCQARKCSRDGCLLSMKGTPRNRVIVDLDSEALRLPVGTPRCDYLFVGEDVVSWVAPIELKSGGFKAKEAVAQLQGGADAVDAWLPPLGVFRFVPVVAHGSGIHPRDFLKLRRSRVTLRGQTQQPVTTRCGRPLWDSLQNEAAP